MNQLQALIRMLLLGAIILASLGAAPVSMAVAQSSRGDATAYESALSGLLVETVGGDFEIYETEVLTYAHGQGEIIDISSNTAFVQVAFFDDTDTNQETLEIYNEGFFADVDEVQVLDEGEERDTAYTFAIVTYNGVEFYYYLSVQEDVVGNVDLLQRIFSTDATFFANVEAAQEAISIGRDGFLEDIDVRDLEDLAGGAARPEPTREPAETPTETPAAAAVPTIDPANATVRDLEALDGELVAAVGVQVGAGSAEVPAFEEIPLAYGDAEAILFFVMRPESPEATLDFILSIFTPENGTLRNIGTDATRSFAWSLDVVEDGADEYLLYVQVRNDRFPQFHYAEILFAPLDGMPDALEDFQARVQVNGVPVFEGAELESIELLLRGGAGVNDREARRDEPGEDEKVETRDAPEDGDIDLASQGLVSSAVYESPQFGTVVEWDDAQWIADTEWPLTAVSDREAGVDSIVLFWAEGNVSIMVQVMASQGWEPEDYVEVWESDEYVLQSVHEDAELLLADSGSRHGGVLYRMYTSDGEEMILVQETIYVDDDVVAIVSLLGDPQVIADAYDDARDLITVDDFDAAGTFTSREIRRELQN
jgi:hypothetical protein